MSEDGGPGRAVSRAESRAGAEQVPPELTKVSPALTARSFLEATNDVLRCQIAPDGKQAQRSSFLLDPRTRSMISMILEKELMSVALDRQLA